MTPDHHAALVSEADKRRRALAHAYRQRGEGLLAVAHWLDVTTAEEMAAMRRPVAYVGGVGTRVLEDALDEALAAL